MAHAGSVDPIIGYLIMTSKDPDAVYALGSCPGDTAPLLL